MASDWQIRCLDCGNTETFLVQATMRITIWIDGRGDFEDDYADHGERRFWKTLECGKCHSTNIERKRARRSPNA